MWLYQVTYGTRRGKKIKIFSLYYTLYYTQVRLCSILYIIGVHISGGDKRVIINHQKIIILYVHIGTNREI